MKRNTGKSKVGMKGNHVREKKREIDVTRERQES
jgi:hypothetical protein